MKCSQINFAIQVIFCYNIKKVGVFHMVKYKVLDEEGIAIRIFHSRYEAKAFLQEGWTIVPIKTKKIDPFELVGECLF